MPFRIALIGCGELAKNFHAPGLARYASTHPDTELVACCDIRPQQAQLFKERFGFTHAETDFEKMLDTHRPNAVLLIVPVDRTCPMTCRILEKGFPVITEKPPGLVTAEIDKMRRAGDAAGVSTAVAFNRRMMPMVQRLMAMQSDAMRPEQVSHIQYEMVRWNRTEADFSTTAVHGIDLVRFVSRSAYKRVQFSYQHIPKLGEGVANIHMWCDFHSGATAQLSFVPIAGGLFERLSLHGQNHSFYLNMPLWSSPDLPGRLQHVSNKQVIADLKGSDVVPPSDDPSYPGQTYGFYDEDAAFFDHVRAKKPAKNWLHDAYQTVAVMQAMRERQNVIELPAE